MGTREDKKVKLANPALRQSMREEYDQGGMEALDLIFGELPTFIARKVRRPDLKEQYEGLSVGQIATTEHKHIIDAMLDLSVADDLRTEWVGPVTNANIEGFRELMNSPYTLPGLSDGGAHIKFITPAIYPTEVLSWLVRDSAVLSLEEAHFRLSGLCAWAAGFKDRGTLREGMAADIVIYDLTQLKSLPEEIAYDLPAERVARVQKAEWTWIMVNGEYPPTRVGTSARQEVARDASVPGEVLYRGASSSPYARRRSRCEMVCDTGGLVTPIQLSSIRPHTGGSAP